jgi:signal transduction histidine kinase
VDTEAALRERVKELTCLYSISKIAEAEDLSIDDIADSVVRLLPPAWQFPDLASARITVDETVYTTNCWREGGPKLKTDIVVDGKKRGFVEVVYIPEKEDGGKPAFLSEERKLLREVARQLGLIIEKKQAEAEKRQLQEQIRHADRLATIGQLSAGIAHELNEPLNSIIGYAQLTEKNENLPRQVREDMEKILKACLYAREVMRKLLFFARQMPSKKSKVDLNEVVRDGLDFLQSQAANRGISIDSRYSGNLPQISADPSQLTQIVVNLVVNAIQAMENGGTLTVHTGADDKSVYLTVEDTGTGIPNEIRDKIFLPFFTTKDVYQGTGLGLAVVHGIVTSHGGTVRVWSKKGEGSRFEVRIPLRGKKH